MKVKVHPHKPMIDNGSEACVSITPVKKHGRAYYMGTVMLAGVTFTVHESGVKRAQDEQQRNVHAWVIGELIHESVEQHEPTSKIRRNLVKVTYDYNDGFFKDEAGNDVTGECYKAAYIVGRDLYVSKEGK